MSGLLFTFALLMAVSTWGYHCGVTSKLSRSQTIAVVKCSACLVLALVLFAALVAAKTGGAR